MSRMLPRRGAVSQALFDGGRSALDESVSAFLYSAATQRSAGSARANQPANWTVEEPPKLDRRCFIVRDHLPSVLPRYSSSRVFGCTVSVGRARLQAAP
jgi:hypothetical protein